MKIHIKSEGSADRTIVTDVETKEMLKGVVDVALDPIRPGSLITATVRMRASLDVVAVLRKAGVDVTVRDDSLRLREMKREVKRLRSAIVAWHEAADMGNLGGLIDAETTLREIAREVKP